MLHLFAAAYENTMAGFLPLLSSGLVVAATLPGRVAGFLLSCAFRFISDRRGSYFVVG